jgi:nucleoside-diphosphate-sugar epimerase
MRVLVIGGTKFIGPYVVRQLAAGGHHVTVYHRGETESDLPASVRHVRDARASRPVLIFPGLLFDPAPDVVIHMIPIGEHDARAAMDACRGHAKRLVAAEGLNRTRLGSELRQ